MMKRRVPFLACVLAAGGLAWSLRAQELPRFVVPDQVVVTLKPYANVAESMVRIGSVAEVQGGTSALRARIAALDLVEFNRVRPETAVTRDQVYFRMRLAGIEERAVQMTGAVRTTVRWSDVPALVQVKATTAPSPSDTTADQVPVQLKVRDQVRLVAKIGPVRVTALGEALQEGRVGQTIRVRNIDSNKIVSGRVVDRNIVEVEY